MPEENTLSSAAMIEGLRLIRRRRLTVFTLFVLFGPFVFLFYKLFGEKIVMLAAFSFLLLYLIAGVRMQIARCPRCGERFHSPMSQGSGVVGKCANCHLPVNACEP